MVALIAQQLQRCLPLAIASRRCLRQESQHICRWPPSSSNVAEMKAWLLDRYASSAFNKCTHQPLPRMDGPPVEIHLVKDAVPRKVSTPATIPLHWQEQVKADLDSDVTLGVIEKVEEPLEWCQGMVCVRRPDGRPAAQDSRPPAPQQVLQKRRVDHKFPGQASQVGPQAMLEDSWTRGTDTIVSPSDPKIATSPHSSRLGGVTATCVPLKDS